MIDEVMLVCSRCKETKPIFEFSKAEANTKRHKRSSYCKACAKEKYSAYYYDNQIERIEYQTARGRNDKLKQRYGITEEDYEILLEKQRGVCAICKNKCTKNKHLSVDHNHTTGKVRGLLCDSCNVGIARFRENTNFLAEAIIYLKNEGFLETIIEREKPWL